MKYPRAIALSRAVAILMLPVGGFLAGRSSVETPVLQHKGSLTVDGQADRCPSDLPCSSGTLAAMPTIQINGGIATLDGHIRCDQPFDIQTYPVDDPNKSLKIGGFETQWKLVVISCASTEWHPPPPPSCADGEIAVMVTDVDVYPRWSCVNGAFGTQSK